MAERKSLLLRLDPAVRDALVRWAGDELRSSNAQIVVGPPHECVVDGGIDAQQDLPPFAHV